MTSLHEIDVLRRRVKNMTGQDLSQSKTEELRIYLEALLVNLVIVRAWEPRLGSEQPAFAHRVSDE